MDEYYRMADAGIPHSEERVELLDGEIIQMPPIGSWHAMCVTFLTEWFIVRLEGRALVRSQNPVRLDPHGEPEPDVALVRLRSDRYVTGHPGPEDVLLLIEVSDTTLRYDRDVKLLRYAEAGIPEVWIVDLELEPDQVLVYRQSRGGAYQESLVAQRGDMLSAAAFPDLTLLVDDLLG